MQIQRRRRDGYILSLMAKNAEIRKQDEILKGHKKSPQRFQKNL